MCYAPVRMVWKADSTFEASSADVSINDRPFSAVSSGQKEKGKTTKLKRTRKRLCLLCRNGPQMLQIALVPDEHDDDVGVGVVTKFLQPPCYVDIGRMLCDVINEQSTDGASVVSDAAIKGSQRTIVSMTLTLQ